MLSAQDSSQKNRLSDILSKHFYITENVFYEEDHKDIGKEDRDKILEVVMDRHTPENRLKRIISQLQ
jgi:hypothetical protein